MEGSQGRQDGSNVLLEQGRRETFSSAHAHIALQLQSFFSVYTTPEAAALSGVIVLCNYDATLIPKHFPPQ